MPRKKEITSKTISPIDFEDVKNKIRDKIMERYKMSVNEFANSDHAKKLKISPTAMNVYLSRGGSNSYPAIKKLCKYLELGSFKRVIEVRKVHTFYME